MQLCGTVLYLELNGSVGLLVWLREERKEGNEFHRAAETGLTRGEVYQYRKEMRRSGKKSESGGKWKKIKKRKEFEPKERSKIRKKKKMATDGERFGLSSKFDFRK
jgi:hypothetical protein